jgi:glycosyltransferase involved in cell wall biosynthesis
MLVGFDASRAFLPDRTGTENYSLNLLKALAKVDKRNRYRVYLRGRTAEINYRSFHENFEFKVVRPSRLWTQLGLALETWKNPVDVLFVPAHTLPVFANPKVKTVVTIHDLGVEYLPGYHKFPQRYYLDFASKYASRHADRIIAVSRATKRDLIRRYGINANKISVVYEGVDRTVFRRQSKANTDRVLKKYGIMGRKYILFVGTIQPRKNIELLIEAFSKLKVADVRLVIAGKPGWDYEGIISAPKRFGVRGKVRFLGRIRDEDLPALYSGASVFAFPSLFEGFGLPILEALACGCPVVASDIGPHREIFEKASLGKFKAKVLVKANDVGEWTNVLYQTITKNDIRFTFNNKNLGFVAELSWIEAAKKTLSVLENVA